LVAAAATAVLANAVCAAATAVFVAATAVAVPGKAVCVAATAVLVPAAWAALGVSVIVGAAAAVVDVTVGVVVGTIVGVLVGVALGVRVGVSVGVRVGAGVAVDVELGTVVDVLVAVCANATPPLPKSARLVATSASAPAASNRLVVTVGRVRSSGGVGDGDLPSPARLEGTSGSLTRLPIYASPQRGHEPSPGD
jgi:hypothetical protein